MKKLYILITFFVFVLLFITLSIKGKAGEPVYYQSATARDGAVGSPFESSGSNSRYALVEAIVENKTFLFTPAQAQFSLPDISAYNGKVFSIFTPGVSFVGIPFYILGKSFGMPQLFAYYSVALFAVLNVYLIYLLARRIGAGFYPSLIAGFIFLFGTNAFPYALSFTQHTMTTSLILMALLSAFGKRNTINNIFLGFVVGACLLMDVVNILFLLPILIYVLVKHFTLVNESNKLKIAFNPTILAFLIGFVPFMIALGIYNYTLSGSYTKVPQMIGNVQVDKAAKNPGAIKQNEDAKKNLNTINLPFQSRRILNGFYILLISNERSWIFYSPVVLLGIGGLFFVYRKKVNKDFVIVSSGVVLGNILTYSMFVDPWGGWAYGARYLIPGAAVLSIAIAPLIDRFKKNYFFIPLFFALATFSIYINTLGAYTTSAVPPKVEAVALDVPIPYTYEYNFTLLETRNLSSSLFYNLYFSKVLPAKDYIMIFSTLLIITLATLYVFAYRERINKEN